MNISLPTALREFVEHQVSANGFETSGEYVCELIRKERDVQRLRELILEGAMSPCAAEVDSHYVKGLRRQYGLADTR